MKNILKLIGAVCLMIAMSFTTADKKTVVIDVSHGGQDNGISVQGIDEKAITLEISNKIKALNNDPNLEIILTRETDKYMSLDKRVKRINNIKPNLVISLHANGHEDKNESGKEIYISDKSKQWKRSGDLALKLLHSFKDRQVEIKKANFYLLKNVDCPIAVVEIGYLTNTNERQHITSEEGQTEIATSILRALK